MRRAVVLLTATLVFPLLPAAAQEPGERVRLSADSAPSRWVVGVLLTQDADSFRLRVVGHPTPIAVARSRVTRLETSRGKRRAVLEGATIGTGLGLITGVVVSSRTAESHACGGAFARLCTVDVEMRVFRGGAIGSALGGLLGAALGSAVKTERWDGMSLGGAHVALAPRGAGLALSLTF